MQFRWTVACLALGFSFSSGCTVSAHGELSEAQCRVTDLHDDDGDGLRDCADPDCWVYDFCLDGKAQPIGGQDAGAPATIDGGSPIHMVTDAAMQDDDDGSVIVPTFDARVPPETCGATNLVCATGELCVDGGCHIAPAGSQFLMRVTGAAVPDQRMDTVCYDNVNAKGAFCSFSPAALCGDCDPDPYVIVSINDVVKLQTTAVTDTQSPGWNESKTQVTLLVGDVIRFTVKDYDPPPGTDATIFICDIVFTDAMAKTDGVIQCYPDRDTTAAPPLGVKWVVNAEYERAPAIAQ